MPQGSQPTVALSTSTAMRIFIQRHSFQSIELQCDVLDTVLSIKMKLQVCKGFPADQAGFTFTSGVWSGPLQDHRTLAHYNIHNDSTLHLLHKHTQVPPVSSWSPGHAISANAERKVLASALDKTKVALEKQSQFGSSKWQNVWALAAKRALELEKGAKTKAGWNLPLVGGVGAAAVFATPELCIITPELCVITPELSVMVVQYAAPTPPSTPVCNDCAIYSVKITC